MYHTSLTIISVLSFLARLGIAFEAPCKFGYARAADGRCQIANKQISHEVRHGFVGTYLSRCSFSQTVSYLLFYFIFCLLTFFFKFRIPLTGTRFCYKQKTFPICRIRFGFTSRKLFSSKEKRDWDDFARGSTEDCTRPRGTYFLTFCVNGCYESKRIWCKYTLIRTVWPEKNGRLL